jgi:adenine phosphoribosyltransferase
MTDASTNPVEEARTRILTRFRWLDGHADVASLFRDPELLQLLGPALAAPFVRCEVTVVVALEAMGFIPATATARSLGVGVALIRKRARPGEAALSTTTRARPDWRAQEHHLSLRRDHIGRTDRALIVDDWAETGSQPSAALQLIEDCGATLVGTSVVVDDVSDGAVRERLGLVGIVRRDELQGH